MEFQALAGGAGMGRAIGAIGEACGWGVNRARGAIFPCMIYVWVASGRRHDVGAVEKWLI